MNSIGDDKDAAVTRKENPFIFQVKNRPLHYVRVQGFYNQDPRAKRLIQTLIVDNVIYFWRKGLPCSDMFFCADYITPPTILTQHQVFTAIMTNISRLPVD